MKDTFYGYKRPDGRVGIRNNVLILPASICASDVCRMVSDAVPGTVSFNNQNGCSQTEKDFKYTLDVLAGFAANPNIYATVVISLGCEVAQMDIVVEAIEKLTNKPMKTLIIQKEGGTIKTMEKAVRYAREFVIEASMLTREEAPISALRIGTNCGGSDPTSGLAANPVVGGVSDMLAEHRAVSVLCETTELIGAEHILAARAKDETVKNRIYEIINRYEESIRIVGEDMRGGQPCEGNKRSGITTIEEKTLGCIHKGGHSTIMEVIDYAQEPTQKGLVIMDTPGNDAASVAGLAAGGCQMVLFKTGMGTPTGNPIAPVYRLTGNKFTFANMEDNIDFDASGVLSGTATIEELSIELFEEMLNVANGKLTKSESLGFKEIAIMRACNYL